MDFESKRRIIEAIDDEVNILHPLLAHILRNLSRVISVENTHGTNEKGADFIVERQDRTWKYEGAG